jgi:hypothetical protein
MNLVGLLTHASSDRSCLPSAFLRQWLLRFAPPRLQWRGRAGFSPASQTTPDRRKLYASEWKCVKQKQANLFSRHSNKNSHVLEQDYFAPNFSTSARYCSDEYLATFRKSLIKNRSR